MDQPSILSLLSTRNTVLTDNTRRESSWRVPTMIPIRPENITRWNDFNITDISNAYGDLLSKPSNIILGQGAIKSFRNQSELRNYALDPLISTLRPLVSESARVLGQRLGFSPTIEWHRDIPLAGPQVVARQAFHPSLTIFADTMPRENLVTGMVHVSSTWCSTDIENDSTNPIQHLGIYAEPSGTRYSFAITDTEVVVIRFHSLNGGETGAQWKAIPRSACGEGTLTINLAIWALIMMSLNDQHRSVVEYARTTPINAWSAHDGFYCNHLSGRRLDYLPTGAVLLDQQI
ncbi:hypothetical protein BFJ72_g1946 [Fusarium proliferatum]|uniref:Uncharacterized protein n=1 Tax=Gibberella intermedia TaxID=948311 RepID=A0A420U1S7_GIBIN|nr:hypothetical protein BFJ72_g1946 [Fusarium proliferatum]